MSSPPLLSPPLCCDVTADIFTQDAGGRDHIAALTDRWLLLPSTAVNHLKRRAAQQSANNEVRFIRCVMTSWLPGSSTDRTRCGGAAATSGGCRSGTSWAQSSTAASRAQRSPLRPLAPGPGPWKPINTQLWHQQEAAEHTDPGGQVLALKTSQKITFQFSFV